MTNATLKGARICNGADWIETEDINRLRQIKAEPLGKKHHPVNHGIALELFRESLSRNNVPVLNQKGMLSNDGLKYIYVADVYDDMQDSVLTNGFINYNDKSKSFTIIMGERVFVCSNECVSHQLSDLRRKHTRNVIGDIRERIQKGIDRFLYFSDERRKDIARLKETPFNENELGRAVLSFHRDGELSNTNIDRIIAEYDNPTYDVFREHTAWNFHNACTEVFKRINEPLARMSMQKKMNDFVHNAVGLKPIDFDEIGQREENVGNSGIIV